MRRLAGFMCALLVLASGAGGADDLQVLRAEIVHSFRQHDPRRAADLIDGYLALVPGDGAMIYNAACAHSLLGDVQRAERHLLDAIKAGFQAFSLMVRDPDIASLRGRPIYQAVVAARQAADSTLAKRRVEVWRSRMEGYRHLRDEVERIDYLSALSDEEQTRLRTVTATHLAVAGALFGDPPRSWMLVALVAPPDAGDLLPSPHMRGRYQHEVRQLVATDLEQSLRHELAHAVHHHDMDRRGQQHPMWLQEGLACLYEAVDVAPDGQVLFPPTERDRQASTLVASGQLVDLTELFALAGSDFGARAAVVYPQVRSLMRFIAAQGQLQAWYDAYTAGFEVDSTGALAFERVFERPLSEVEIEWRAWAAGAGSGAQVHPGMWITRSTSAPADRVSGLDAAAAATASASERRRHFERGLGCMRRGDLPSAWVSWTALRPLDPSLASLLENLMRHAVRPSGSAAPRAPGPGGTAEAAVPRMAACARRRPASI